MRPQYFLAGNSPQHAILSLNENYKMEIPQQLHTRESTNIKTVLFAWSLYNESLTQYVMGNLPYYHPFTIYD